MDKIYNNMFEKQPEMWVQSLKVNVACYKCARNHIKGIVHAHTLKTKFCCHLLNPMSFQTCLIYFL